MSKNKLTYTSAITELEAIVQDIESGEIDVDVLTAKVKRASELIRFCKDSLRNTQKKVEKTLVDIEPESKSEEE
ncbi:MAG: exodeoxyribonuclease VII small subunit [Nitrospirae bacterium CG_4_10_14_0_8_um_filter_41_23]|nr:exodeoxyribonuclease VII small subunit [Nitrospirota bacterium]PIQ94078.1 MAG: exodeoxyribonuclease VII small subunit [Nitrospirae bacterium CG11_big_fil_rev_8_21_14_0_20_41_14]PIV43670.1 MAG: exodeoxyribonuclease VII small subunit [Nitrospirae bacterium CG02_land_8_20_14_3_00_41_53]PIW86312.1 MAG: exodeoxyribonuclease VII small subunit [Nitrospirae bacterium CG_4_8_14_3_um_filter_41_47]PIY86640.1 MAG: exodeoxyribonuclease VII small subunit [Nitrospirae bacterium CG_4_10_14_0_8_um_filter_41_